MIERVVTARGELALRRRGDVFEIISNGVFLMDTSDGRSERLLVRLALDAVPAAAPHLLIGGLGVGFSLAEAVRHRHVAHVTVVEIEPKIIEWYVRHLHPVDDPRWTVVCADLLGWLDEPGPEYDVVCVDIDNGPQWTVFDGNRALYTDAGLDALRRRLTAGGVLAVWSAARSTEFEDRLRAQFSTVDIHEVPVSRGEPDVVYVARGVT